MYVIEQMLRMSFCMSESMSSVVVLPGESSGTSGKADSQKSPSSAL